MTIWLKIEGWDYEINNLAQVRRIGTTKIRKTRICSGYEVITLSRNGKASNFGVHVLVCQSFVGDKPSPSHEVAHNNGLRLDNRPENLRWATRKENHADKLLHGTHTRGTRDPRAKLTEVDVNKIRQLIGSRPLRQIAKDYNISRRLIERIRDGQAWAWLSAA